MPYITLTEISNPSQPRAVLVNIAHIQIISTRKVANYGDTHHTLKTYIEIAGRADVLDVAETPTDILRAIEEAGHA
jgi:hypothetical protein